MSLVSVIIPAHNAAETIECCLTSVLSQTYDSLQVIVIDDASSDRTSEIVSGYDDQRITLVQVTYRSAAAARNRGLDFAKGDLIQFLDADDALSPTKIENQVRDLQSGDSIAIANCSWGHFDTIPSQARMQHQKINRSMSPHDWLIESWSGGGMAQTACWLAPRLAIEKAGRWDDSLKGNPNDDGEFFCRVLLAVDKIIFTSDSYVYYRSTRVGCVSQVVNSNQAKALLEGLTKCEGHLRAAEDTKRTRTAAAQNYYRYIYQFQDRFPLLASAALEELARLDMPTCAPLGPSSFRTLVKLFGFKYAMKLRCLKRDAQKFLYGGSE